MNSASLRGLESLTPGQRWGFTREDYGVYHRCSSQPLRSTEVKDGAVP